MTTIRMRTVDSLLRVRNRGRDAMLTPNTRLAAEPANPPERGDFGTIWDGDNSGAVSPGADVETIWSSIVKGISMLHPADVAKMKALMQKYSGAPAGATGEAGVTSVGDRAYPTAANRQIAMETARIREVQDANREFWDRMG